MKLNWVSDKTKTIHHAKVGKIIIGTVLVRTDGSIVWYVDGVTTKWICKGRGETTTIRAGKEALTRSWKRWLTQAGFIQ